MTPQDRASRYDSSRYDKESDYDDEQENFERPNWLTEMPYWAVSAVLHLILLVILLLVVQAPSDDSKNEIPIVVKTVTKKPEYDPNRKRTMERKERIERDKQVEKPVIEKKIEEVTPDIPKGTDLSNLTNANFEATSINTAIGAGGGAAGSYGERTGRGSLVREGGSEATEEAVRAALEWLRRHQSPDGSWKAAGFGKMAEGKSRNVNHERYPTDRGWEEHDVGVTALAMLAFTGYGHTHRFGAIPEYVEVLKKAVRYMKSVQVRSNDPVANGRYGSETAEQWIYNHAIAAMAMGELLVMSNDVIGLKKSVTDAVKLVLRAQNDGFGWRYEPKAGDNDTSVTGWMVLALKTAKNARLDIPTRDYAKSFDYSLNWFNRVTATNGKAGYMVPGDEGSRLAEVHADPYPFSKDVTCMTAVSVLCRLFAGESRKSPQIRKGVDLLMRAPPVWREQKGRVLSTINLYYWYYGSYAVFQFGGPSWKQWNDAMQKALVTSQRRGGDEDGSWDPIGEWGIAGGRVYSTAIGAMTLEVYYRFRRAQEGVGF